MSQTSLLSFFGKKSASNETDQCDSEDEEDEEVDSPERLLSNVQCIKTWVSAA